VVREQLRGAKSRRRRRVFKHRRLVETRPALPKHAGLSCN